MAFYLSPLVAVNEIDLTTTIPAVATSIAVTVLRNTYKGPELKKFLATDEVALMQTFGKPTDVENCYQDLLSAAGYLRYGNALYCTRVMPEDATFAGTKATSGADGSTVTFDPFVTGTTAYKLSDLTSKDPDNFPDDITVSGTSPFYLIASSRGAWGNNIKVTACDYTNYVAIGAAAEDDATYGTWDTSAAIRGIDSALTDKYDFLIIVQTQDQFESSYSIKEIWNVSTKTNRVDDQGQRTFAETIINQQSKYIRIAMNAYVKDQEIAISSAQWQSFGGGSDTQVLAIADPDIEAAFDLYANGEEIDVNIFIDSNKSDNIKRYIGDVDGLAAERKDAMAVLDCQKGDVVNNNGSETEALRSYRRDALNINTSYSALYGNWLEVYDKYNGKYRWIPASGHVAGIFANTDNTRDPWFAPAGLNRAILGNVRRLAWNPTQGQRDILYKNGINPIVSFAGQGKVIWGQKTQLDKSSAFDRINVRRLFIVLEKAISTACKYLLFEPNDDLTRLLMVNMIDPFLRDVRSRRGIYDYMVVCDQTNNTPERIDRNELWCDIYIKPTRAAEFIVLNFIATKTGASFTEIAGVV